MVKIITFYFLELMFALILITFYNFKITIKWRAVNLFIFLIFLKFNFLVCNLVQFYFNLNKFKNE